MSATGRRAKGRARANGYVRELSREEAWELLEEHTRARFHIGVQEFIDKWFAGEYGEPDDNPDALEIAVLLPGIGVDPWRDDKRT